MKGLLLVKISKYYRQGEEIFHRCAGENRSLPAVLVNFNQQKPFTSNCGFQENDGFLFFFFFGELFYANFGKINRGHFFDLFCHFLSVHFFWIFFVF